MFVLCSPAICVIGLLTYWYCTYFIHLRFFSIFLISWWFLSNVASMKYSYSSQLVWTVQLCQFTVPDCIISQRYNVRYLGQLLDCESVWNSWMYQCFYCMVLVRTCLHCCLVQTKQECFHYTFHTWLHPKGFHWHLSPLEKTAHIQQLIHTIIDAIPSLC